LKKEGGVKERKKRVVGRMGGRSDAGVEKGPLLPCAASAAACAFLTIQFHGARQKREIFTQKKCTSIYLQ